MKYTIPFNGNGLLPVLPIWCESLGSQNHTVGNAYFYITQSQQIARIEQQLSECVRLYEINSTQQILLTYCQNMANMVEYWCESLICTIFKKKMPLLHAEHEKLLDEFILLRKKTF